MVKSQAWCVGIIMAFCHEHNKRGICLGGEVKSLQFFLLKTGTPPHTQISAN